MQSTIFIVSHSCCMMMMTQEGIEKEKGTRTEPNTFQVMVAPNTNVKYRTIVVRLRAIGFERFEGSRLYASLYTQSSYYENSVMKAEKRAAYGRRTRAMTAAS